MKMQRKGMSAMHSPFACPQVGFNVELGGYFSIKRNAVSIFGDTFLAVDQVVPYCKALLEVFRCAPCLCTPDSP